MKTCKEIFQLINELETNSPPNASGMLIGVALRHLYWVIEDEGEDLARHPNRLELARQKVKQS